MKIEALIIHHSAGLWGDREYLDSLHEQMPRIRGVQMGASGTRRLHCGYHKIVLNGLPTYRDWREGRYQERLDGHIQQGRPDNKSGAHARGWNARSLGVVLIGHLDLGPPTARQWASLVHACARLCQRHGLPASAIRGHREVAASRCPGAHLDLSRLRGEVGARLTAG